MKEKTRWRWLKKPISIVLAVIIAVSTVPFVKNTEAADTPAATALNTYYTVVGDLMNGNGYGDDWAPANTAGLMQEYYGGLYEKTLHLKAGTYSYKIAQNGGWTTSYNTDSAATINADGNITLTVAADEDVIFRFDYSTKTVTDSVNNPDAFKTSATLTGSMEGWTPSDASYDLTYVGGGFYSGTFTLAAGTYEYKVAYNHAWSNGEVSDNVSFSLSEDTRVTFVANPLLGICEDSVNVPTLTKEPSLIGDVRTGIDSTVTSGWDQTATGWEFQPLAANGVYVYSALVTVGSYSYKAVNNYSWADNGVPSSNNNSLTTTADDITTDSTSTSDTLKNSVYVIFVVDEANGKLYDSVSNPDEVSKILGVASGVKKGATTNANGTVTFNYKDANASSVYLSGDVVSAQKLMSKDDNGNWSITLRLGDEAKTVGYQFIVDGQTVNDPTNGETTDNGQSALTLSEFTGRKVTLPGTLLDNGWNAAASSDLTMQYQGDGIYTLTIPNLAAGSYQYKVAIDGSWTENYGLNGIKDGSNISVTVDTAQDVTFTYNDDSHKIVNSISYQPADVQLTGSAVSGGSTAMTDPSLSTVYSTTLTLPAGTYSDFAVSYNGASTAVGAFTLDAGRTVTFSYDPASDTVFTDLSDQSIDTNEVYFDSQDTTYKSPYGAVKAGTTVSFSIKTKKDDVNVVKLVIIDESNAKKSTYITLSKDGTFDDTHDKWSGTFTPDEKGLYKYYFVLSNGAQVKAYGDDDGNLGTGAANDLGAVMNYDLNVTTADYTTPDWLKNAIVYQIFPDRFFDGDESNDTAKLASRGDTYYQYQEDWYAEPSSPALENDSDTVYNNDIYGGDLKGIEEKLDYLQALGVTAIYVNPINDSVSNHRYDVSDYSEIDPFLGDIEDYVSLATEINKRGMHLIIDGVYNHVSDDSKYFDRYGKYVEAGQPLGAYQYWSAVYDKMNADATLTLSEAETQVQAYYTSIGITDFHYKDWFIVRNEKVAAADGDPAHYDYDGWNGYDSMPEIQALNGSEDNVTTWKDEILAGSSSTTDQWLEDSSTGTTLASGVRLDAAEQLSDQTWKTLRDSVKSISEEDALIGEIWTDSSKYLLGDEFDSVMNYLFRGALTSFVSGGTASAATETLEAIRERYPTQAFQAMLNIVDSHDTQRIRSTLEGDTESIATEASDTSLQQMKLVAMMQMTYPGAPTIYYGDELGMIGDSDPDCRRAMAWGEGSEELVEAYALYANIRNAYSVLRTGDISPLDVGNDSVLAYTRSNDTDKALVLLNNSSNDVDGLTVDVSGQIADGTTLYDATNGTAYTVADGKVTVNVSGIDGLILVTNYKTVTINTEALKPAYDSSYKVAKRDLSSKAVDADSSDVETVTQLKNDGASALEVSDATTVNEVRLALEEGLNVTVNGNDGSTTLTLTGNSMSSYITQVPTLSTSKPTAAIQSAIAKAVKEGNATLLAALTLTSNLTEEAIAQGATLTLNVGTAYSGKTVYLYYYADDGTATLVDSTEVKNGQATFSVPHLSTYFVLDTALAAGDTGNTSSSSSSNNGTSSTASSSDTAGASSTSSTESTASGSQTSETSSAASSVSSESASSTSNPTTGQTVVDALPAVIFTVLCGALPIAYLSIKKKRRE